MDIVTVREVQHFLWSLQATNIVDQWFWNGGRLAHYGRNFSFLGGNLFQGGIGKEKRWMKKT